MPKQTALDTINRLIAEENSGGAARTRSSGTISRIDQLIEEEEERERQQEEEQQRRQQAARNASSAGEVMDLVRSYGDYGLERRAAEMPRPVREERRTLGPNALTPEMEARRQAAAGVNRAPTAYQTYMMQAANSQPAQEETRSTDELRRDMNKQNRLAAGMDRMAADASQGIQNRMYDRNYTGYLRNIETARGQQEARAAAATNLYQALSTQRREQEEREKYAALMQNPDFAAKSRGDPAIGRKVSATSLSPAERLYVSIYNHGGEKTNAKDRNAAEFVSDEEAGVFFYLWNTQGPRAAQAYYNDYVDNRASQRRAEEAQAQAEAFGRRDILGSSAESVVTNAVSGVGLVDMAWQNLARSIGLTDKNKPLNYYSSAQLPSLVTDAMRKGAADEIAAAFPGMSIGKGENAVNVASFLYQTGMSMADSGVAILLNRIGIPEPLTLANMGAAAGTRAIRDARERGASDGQALAFGISSAIMEGLFEKISLDRILKESNAHNLAQSILGTLQQGFTEGSEEVMTTLANTAADMFIMGDKAEVYAMQRRLMEQGVSEKEALKAAFTQWGTGILGDAIGGFISGAGMGGVKEFSNARNNPLYQWNMPMAEARALQNIEQNGIPQERGITPELQADIDAGIQAQNEREMAQDREMLAQDAERRREAAQRRAAPPLPRQAGQITPESVTTPPLPGDAQGNAESAEGAGGRIATAPAGPRNDGGRGTGDPLISTSGTASPRGSRETGGESQTLGNPPVPGVRLDETGGNNSGEARLRIAPLPERENPVSGLRIGNRQQQEKAQQRQRQMESQTAESLKNRGFENAGEEATVYVRNEDQWDAEERAIAERLRQGGTEPTFVTGLLQNAEGQKVSFLRYGDQLALQTDNRRESLSSIVNRATGITITETEGNRIGQAENSAAAVGQQAEWGEDAPAAAEARDQLFDGGRGRILENGAGEQAGSQKNEALRQIDRAGRRRSQKEDIERVSVGSLGIRGAGENSEARVLRESGWDEELRTTAQAVERATGCKVSYVLDGIRLPNGVRARGVYTGDRIIIQADHNSVSVKKLAAHEAYHAFANADAGLNARIRERIIEQGKGGKLDETLRTYVTKLAATVGLSEDMDQQSYEAAINRLLEEIYADAYAGINAYGAEAGQFTEEARETVGAARSAENAAATERRTGPPERYSAEKKIEAPYNRTALLTEDTVDRWLKDYASESSPKYAQAYVTRMSPDQFLKLTTSRTGRLVVNSQTGPMDADQLIKSTQAQPLQLIIRDGEVVGHEGRHRVTALSRANVQSIPVLVFDSSNKNSKTDVPEMVLQGQDFGSSRSYDRVTLENMIPLSYENRDRIVQEYGKQDAFERSAEKLGYRRTMKFSAEIDAEYMDAAEAGDTETAQRMVDEAAEAAGYTIHAYHGTGRADRVGNVFRADRATSGPMAFFTDSKDIAENYSRDKRDTSLAYDTDYDSYETQFRAKHTKTGKDFAIYKLWGYIPLSERAKIKEKARHVRANWEGEGEIIYDPQATEANGGWSYQLQEFKGDVLKALNEQWLNSGNLFNEEEQYLKVLELAGVTDALKKAGFEMPRYMNPDYREEAVYDVFLKIQNPFDATSMIDEDFIRGFEDFAVDNEERFTKESVDADYWDKNSVSAEEFAERMRDDLERGVTHAWTSIPDVMSEYLKSLGYDGIKDAGGKNGGQGHTVWIPFTSEQIKRTDPVTYDDAGNIIPLSERFNPENDDIRYSAEEEIPQSAAAQGEAQTLGSREILDTPALKKLGVKVSGSVGDYGKTESLIAKDRAAKSIRKEAVRAERRLKATDAEKDFANGITAGIYREEDIPARLNKDTVMELADYYWAVNSANLQTLHQLRADINQGLRDEAEGFLAEADIKPISMIELNERTPERAFRKMFGEKAQGITKWLLDPVRENEAEKIRWYNQQMDAVRKFTDSKGKSRKLTRAESALTMRLMEGRAAADMVAGMETKAAIENAAANIRKGGDAADAAREFSLSGEERDLAEKYAGWLDTQEELKTADSTIVEAAAKKYAELFDDYYDAINDFLVAHGYEPIGYIKGYAPHMQPEENQSLLEKAFKSLGINEEVTALPASIAGQTTFFKPNKRWNPYFLQRTGSEANYDIVKAYQSYVDYMADILYHTDDVMRVRQTANWIRKTYAPEEIREKLDWAQELRNAPTEDKQRLLRDAGKIGQSTVLSAVDTTKAMQEYIDGLYEQIGNSTKNSNLVMWLDNYANILAGKQSFADRGWEYSTGRKSLNIANKLNNAFQKANVAGNLSSILNQTAQLPMIYAELGERDFLKAVADLANRNTKVWAQDSDFLTAKEGKELLYTDNADKFVNLLFAPAGFMDHLVSTVAVRGAFNKAIRQGASYAEAMQKADAFGQAVMGSRAKGSRPLAYESKGFFSKMVHMFQIEAVNSWDHLASDLPREIRQIAKTQGKPKAAAAMAGLILRALIGAFALNRLTDEIYGGTPAPFDILGLTANFVASGKGLSTNAYIRTIIDNTMEKMGHERLFGTEPMAKEDFDLEAAADDLLYNVMNDVPLVRNAAGVLGLGDQTVALPGAGGEFKNLGTAVKNMLKEGVEPGEIGNLLKAMGLAATQFIPGGRQISKTAQGVEAIIRGGSYNGYKNPKLQYPLEGATDLVKALLFGKNATNAAKEYWAAGGNALTEKQTALYTALASHGVGRKEAYDAIQKYREIANDDSLTSFERGKAERALLAGLDISDEDKLDMYRELNNAEGTAEKFRAIMDTGLSFDQVMTIQDKYAEIDGKEEFKAGDKAKEFYLWVDNQSYTAKQKTEIKDQLKYFQSIPAEAARYDKLAASGLSPDMSAKIDQAIGKLEPEAGKTDVSDTQKWRAAMAAVSGEANQEKALQALMTEEQYAKYQKTGVSPTAYVNYKAAVSELVPLEGQKGITNAQKWNAALKSLGPKASKKDKLALVGDIVGTEMTTETGKQTQWAKINRIVDSGKSVEDTMKLVEDDKLDNYVTWMDSDAKAAGIKSDMYIAWRETSSSTSSTRDENEKEVKGETRKDKLIAYIDGLNLTQDQKDVLFLEEYKEKSLSDTPWHKGGGKGSGSYARARTPALRIPAVPTVSKPGSGLRIRGTESEPARQSSGLRIRAATPAAQPTRSGLRIKAQ